jgi:hypothetical protein
MLRSCHAEPARLRELLSGTPDAALRVRSMLALAFLVLTVHGSIELVGDAQELHPTLIFARVSVRAPRAYYVEQLPDEWPRTDECDEW